MKKIKRKNILLYVIICLFPFPIWRRAGFKLFCHDAVHFIDVYGLDILQTYVFNGFNFNVSDPIHRDVEVI